MRVYNVISDDNKFKGLYININDVTTLLTVTCTMCKTFPKMDDNAILKSVEYIASKDGHSIIQLATPQYGTFRAVRLALACGIVEMATKVGDDAVIQCAHDATTEFVDTVIDKIIDTEVQ